MSVGKRYKTFKSPGKVQKGEKRCEKVLKKYRKCAMGGEKSEKSFEKVQKNYKRYCKAVLYVL